MSTTLVKPLLGIHGEREYDVLRGMLEHPETIPSISAQLSPFDFRLFAGHSLQTGLSREDVSGCFLRERAAEAIFRRGATSFELLRKCLENSDDGSGPVVSARYIAALFDRLSGLVPVSDLESLVASMVADKAVRDAAKVEDEKRDDDGEEEEYEDELPELPLVSTGGFETISITPEPGEKLTIPYVVEGVLPEGQPTVIGGHAKTLKTSTLIDLFASIVSGEPFLGNPAFAVAESRPVLLASCESGPHTIREVFDRVCRAKGCDPGKVQRKGFHFTPKIPNLQDEDEIASFESLIGRTGAKVVGVDPLYQAGIGDTTTNMSKFGELVKPLAEACSRRGATLVVCHHFKQGAETRSLGLGSFFGSGTAQWARAWILLGQLADFKFETGEHRLRMILGGSAGHASDWELNVREGRREDRGGRVWSVATQPAKEPQVAGRRVDKAADRKGAVLAAIKGFSSPDTFTAIRNAVRFGGEPLKAAVDALVASGEVRRRRVTKGRRSCECFEAVAKGAAE